MAKIIPLRFGDLKKIEEMIEYVNPALSSTFIHNETLIYDPFSILNKFLPIDLKFKQECYVAVQDKQLLGFLSLIPDGNKKTRWKINRLILDLKSADTGKQLIDYVVNKYGGAGVEAFLTTIDNNQPQAISLFHNECSFRRCSYINIWEYQNLAEENFLQDKNAFRNIQQNDAKKLYQLDEESLFPQHRFFFTKTINDFNFGIHNNLVDSFSTKKTSRFALDNPVKDSIECFISLQSKEDNVFFADITLSLAYQDYYEEALSFIIKHVRSINKNAKLFISIRDYYQSAKKMTNTLVEHDFKHHSTFQVLVKDYWKIAENPESQKAPMMTFPDMTSPACNISQFINDFDSFLGV